jgi:outer membrane receptor protein involved in Fe transport
VVDGDSTELVVGATDVPDLQHQVSEELTVARGTSRLTLVGGAFFFRDHNEGHAEITNYLGMIQIRPFAMIDTQAWALFGQATYRASARVSVTGGVRYSDEQKDLDTTGGVYRLGTPTLISPATFYAFVETANFDAWTPKASIQARRHATPLPISPPRGGSRAADSIQAKPCPTRRRSAPNSPGAMKVD